MTGSFQQQARIRKLVYFLLIAGLFTGTLLLRRHVVEVKAQELALREQHLGEVELTGSALYLSLTGSRGVVVCYLWVLAQEKQKRNEWNELELIVNSLTRLQPHFIRPWIFQGWNLSYNVSVECDRVSDKYFYVSRGIEILTRGERRNRDNPDLRNEIGWYYQNKLGMADENNYFRSLFKLSCIDPRERDPDRLRRSVDNEPVVDMEAFLKFCQAHPILVRQLRDKLARDRPDKVVAFLEENRRVPSLFDTSVPVTALGSTPLKKMEDRFPLLPPPYEFETFLNYERTPVPEDEHDNFSVARAWFGYAQDPVDRGIRKPRSPALIIFQGYPARAQAYHAERLEQAGWFDKEGWLIRDWFTGKTPRERRTVAVGEVRSWAQDAWEDAHRLYLRHGLAHALLNPRTERPYTPQELQLLSAVERDDYNFHHQVSNFRHFFFQTMVERRPETVQARKQFFKADQERGSPRAALRMYQHPAAFNHPLTWGKELTGWKKILAENPEFRRDMDVQEEMYEHQYKYLELERDLSGCLGEQVKALGVIQKVLGHAASGTHAAALIEPGWMTAPGFRAPLVGPFDDTVEDVVDGHPTRVPFISRDAIERARTRLEKPTQRAPQVTPATTPAGEGNPERR